MSVDVSVVVERDVRTYLGINIFLIIDVLRDEKCHLEAVGDQVGHPHGTQQQLQPVTRFLAPPPPPPPLLLMLLLR